MASYTKKGAEEARNQLPSLLEAAEGGRATVITKHGKPVAALVPISALDAHGKQSGLVKLRGSGRGFWGDDAAATIDSLRHEWDR